ncbi:hypothetical protein OH492_12985 [Vibrio chagasii]|nr:hypothetical protein [Vibrio chagasii]
MAFKYDVIRMSGEKEKLPHVANRAFNQMYFVDGTTASCGKERLLGNTTSEFLW